MEPEVRERFERIERNLRLSSEEFDKRHKAAMARMDRSDKKVDRLQKLVEVGWKAITSLAAEGRRARADTAALRAEMRAFRKAQGNGHGGSNGGGRR